MAGTGMSPDHSILSVLIQSYPFSFLISLHNVMQMLCQPAQLRNCGVEDLRSCATLHNAVEYVLIIVAVGVRLHLTFAMLPTGTMPTIFWTKDHRGTGALVCSEIVLLY